MSKKVFLSYAHGDANKVEQYARALGEAGGIKVFWDRDIPAGTSYLKVLATELRESAAVVLFLSKSACDSEFVIREINQAHRRKSRVIPVALEALEEEEDSSGLLLLVDTIQAIPAHALGFESTMGKLVAAVRKGGGDKQATDIPVVAVMGTKGGVGKSSFIKATAEVIASSGHSVVIIDSDTETAGISREYGSGSRSQAGVCSTLGMAYGWREGGGSAGGDGELLEITPKYLAEEGGRCGKVYLVPGRLNNDTRPGYEAIADIPGEKRNEAALEILKDIIEGAVGSGDDIRCVLIDCGAENNPMVSAGFVIATYGFVVSGPDPRLQGDIPRLNSMHRDRYPDGAIDTMVVVVNQATSETASLWGNAGGCFFVGEDTAHRLATARGGGLDFKGVGFSRYYLDVLRAIKGTFGCEHQHLLPDEGEVWVKPFLEDISELPRVILERGRYKFLGVVTMLKMVAALLVVATSVCLFVAAPRSVHFIEAEKEVVKPASEDEAVFAEHLSELSIPAGLAGKLWLEGNTLKSRGELGEGAFDELKSAVGYSPIADALSELALLNRTAVRNAERTEDMLRQMGLFIFVGAVCLAVFTFLSWRKFSKRKALLKGILAARSDGGGEVAKLAQMLLSEETGKSRLRWLREEWDRYASDRLAETLRPFLGKSR